MSSWEGLTRSLVSGVGAIITTFGVLSWFPNLANFFGGNKK
jgi:hypothetical protein